MPKPAAIKPLKKSLDKNGINIVVYGPPGTAKTPLAASGADTLILDADGGLRSARDAEADAWAINIWEDLETAYDYLRNEPHDYKWVWFDGISIGQDKLLEGIMADIVAAKPHRLMWQIDKGEYGQNMQRMKQWIRHMVALPINFGITAHPFIGTVPVTEDEMVMPWIQGSNMSPTICGYFDIVAYMQEEEGAIKMHFKSEDGEFMARDRTHSLGTSMKNPTVPKIEKRIKEGGPSVKAKAKKSKKG